MATPTTVDMPEHLHERLSERAKAVGASIPELILNAIEDAYRPPRKGKMITGSLIKAGKLGPEFPTDENPHDLAFP